MPELPEHEEEEEAGGISLWEGGVGGDGAGYTGPFEEGERCPYSDSVPVVCWSAGNENKKGRYLFGLSLPALLLSL